jgi:hypothetical protein
MSRPIVRELILPAALTVTTFVLVAACGGDDDEDTGKGSSAVVACADLSSGDCAKCKEDDGKVSCGPSKNCFATSSGGCSTGSNS